MTTTTGFGTLWLAPRLSALYEKYPDLKIDLMLEERVLDLPMREADVAIRMKEPCQADLIRKRLMNIRMRLYASRDYLAENGMPMQLEDLTPSPPDLSGRRHPAGRGAARRWCKPSLPMTCARP